MTQKYILNSTYLIFSLFNLIYTENSGTKEISSKNNLIALPYAFYSPETKIAFGVGSIYSFRPQGTDLAISP
jgi:hypothetical protein